MTEAADAVIDRVKVREVAGVFRSRDALDAAVEDLLLAGFDRVDIDIMASVDAVREKLGDVYVAPEELPDLPEVPRRAYVAREDVTVPVANIAGILTYIGATAAALGVVASGGALALAALAAAAGGAVTGGLGALLARAIGKEWARELEEEIAAGGIVVWVRVHSPEQEEKAQRILRSHGARAVRAHEIEIDRRLEHLPLSSVRQAQPLGRR